MNGKKVGLLGLMAAALVGFLSPATASAQERCFRNPYYAPAPIIYRDQCWRERDWQIAREREIIRQREWRARHGFGPYGYR